MTLSRRNFLAAVGAGALAACSPAGTKHVRIVCGSGAGATSDMLVRLFARHLARFGVNATVENLSRGGGKLAAQMVQDGPADGSVLGALQTSLLYSQLLDDGHQRWDLASMQWMGSFCIDHRALVVTGASGVQHFEELLTRSRPVTVAASSAAGPGLYESAIIRYLTGARLKIVPGFAGGARMLAMISGEVEGALTALDGAAAVLEMPGTRILLRVNDMPLPPGIPRSAGLDIPCLSDVARPGPDTAPLIALVEAHNRLGRIIALPPSCPPPVVEQWRTTFARVLSDPQFREDAARQHFLIERTDGDAVGAQLIDVLRAQRPSVEGALRRAIDEWADA